MSEKPTEELTVKHPESPTTGRELDFDDDDGPEASLLQDKPKDAPAPKRVSFQEVQDEDAPPPAQPPRPKNPNAEKEATLIEAFPTVDPKVIRAVLSASGGQVEPAFNALLGMSDPDFVPDTPPRPVRPAQPALKPRAQMSQMEQDELYARQLAEHYNAADYSDSAAYGYGTRGQGDPPLPRRGGPQTGQNLKPNEMYDREHSFFDEFIQDDLPVIKQSIQQGFKDTQKTFNKWINDFRKKIDGEDEDDLQEDRPPVPPRRQNFGPSQSDQLYGIRRSADRSRRSGERDRYDSDPTVLSDDFTQLELHDNESGKSTKRPLANPDLFKPLPTGPTPQSGPVDEVDALYRQPTPTGISSASNAAKANPNAPSNTNKKWQPLTSVAPNPEAEDDHDPFSLGDSDEEKEDEKKTDLRPEDSERLKSVSGASGSGAGLDKTKSGSGAGLEEHERSGSLGHKDAVAEELLTGKKS